jgi:hypothetical protein
MAMKRAQFTREVVESIDSAIAAFGLNPGNIDLREAILDDLFKIMQRSIDTGAVFKAQKKLLKKQEQELAGRLANSCESNQPIDS